MTRRLAASLFLGLTVFFGYLFYTQYLKWYACFDDTGRCFDPQTGAVYMAQSGMVWFGLITISVLGLAMCMWIFRSASR